MISETDRSHVNVGLYLDVRNPAQWGRAWPAAYRAVLELCDLAEALGAHSVWLPEHHLFADGYLPQPLTLASAIAARTSRIRIGTAVVLAPLRRPAHILEEANVVDLVSDGRLDLGLGAGYRQTEFELFGAKAEEPLAALFDCVTELRRLADIVTPPSAQSPLPLWLGCNGPRGARRTGQLGERLLSVDPALAVPYVKGLKEAGWPTANARMSGPVNLFLSDDPERDWPAIAPYYAYVWESYARSAVEGTTRRKPQPVDPDKWRARGLSGGLRGMLVATPDEAADELRRRFEAIPVHTIFMWAWLPGIPDELVARHIELACKELPLLLGSAR